MDKNNLHPVPEDSRAPAGDPCRDDLFSSAPRDMTPVKQDYTPGLGDRMDAISYTLEFGNPEPPTGARTATNYEQALEIQKMVANITNGAHTVVYMIGQDALRWGTAPYLIEDVEPPMGDGTPGSGYRKYKEYVEASFENNADVSQILEPLLAGSQRDEKAQDEDDVIPLSCYSHDENGEKKIGWTWKDRKWYMLSLYNLYETGYAQKAWRRMQERWNFRNHLYYDAMIPVPEGLYNNPNLTDKFGGTITNTEMEWEAVKRECVYSWENFAISSAQEHLYPPYKGLSCYFSVPYGNVTEDDYLNTWQNSIMIATRRDGELNMVWGSEIDGDEESYHFEDAFRPGKTFITRLMEHNFQYLYMMERKPLSYTNDEKIHKVVFSGGLVSAIDRETGNYTLVENGDFIIADGGDRFIPQVGAGCKIFAYSRDGKTRTWKLPPTWDGIEEIDVYALSVERAPEKIGALTVKDGTITLEMSAGAPYLLVPKGDAPTPRTANFNDLADGASVGSYQSLCFDLDGAAAFKVYGANARGGFGSPSVCADSTDKIAYARIGMEKGAILHSFKVGNRGGEGRVVLHSSDPRNEDVMLTLPERDRVCKFNTGWRYGEIAPVSVKIENTDGAYNVLFDAFVYTETSAASEVC